MTHPPVDPIIEELAHQTYLATLSPAERFYLEHQDLASQVARAQHKKSTIFELEDIEQAIWVAVYAQVKKLVGRPQAFVRNFMARAAVQWAEAQRVEHMHATACFIYNPDIVRHQLELGAWESDPDGDWDMRLDVRKAYERLEEAEQEVLVRAYRKHESIKSSTDRMRLLRAIDKMAAWLNGQVDIRVMAIDEVLHRENS